MAPDKSTETPTEVVEDTEVPSSPQKFTPVAPGIHAKNSSEPECSARNGTNEDLQDSCEAPTARVTNTAPISEPGSPEDFTKPLLTPIETSLVQDTVPLDSQVASDDDQDQAESASTSSAGYESDDSSTKSRKERLSSARKSSEGRFVRAPGIIYVANEFWDKCEPAADNCYFYVASSAVNINSSMTVEELRAQGKGSPPRFKIQKSPLFYELQRLTKAFAPAMNISNHCMPYRQFVPHEQRIRERLQELESEFAEISQDHPYHSAVQRSAEDIQVIERPEDDIEYKRQLLDGFRTLIHFLDNDLQELVQDYRQIKSGTVEKLPFSHLWHLFTPGQEICTRQPYVQLYRVLQVTGGRNLMKQADGRRTTIARRKTTDLLIDCFHIEFDGVEYRPVPTVIRIKPYYGARAIASLPVYPMALARPEDRIQNGKTLSDLLQERGMKYENLTQLSHRRYHGLSILEAGKFDTLEEIEGDVIIDAPLTYRNKIPTTSFEGGVLETPTEEDRAEYMSSDEHAGFICFFEDTDTIKNYWLSWSLYNTLLESRLPGGLSPESYRLLSPKVYGYSLLNRKWYPLHVDLVHEVPKIEAGKDDGFDKLVLPLGHKDIVRALVKTHARKVGLSGPSGRVATNALREFDVVKGKGRGLIILLHGAPGVGKTSTAECVAANVGKPLFPITCGDIGGETAQEVERNLEKYFDLARKWDCVLLLDEADVFLGTRESGNIRQSSLVSVFLRVLEYYSGILILTTNRVGSFDEAIKSRVHCALYYPLLDKDNTFKIWQMNIKSLEERNATLDPKLRVRFDPKAIEDFARRHWKNGNKSNRWNGRQIKNAFQTAVALADWDNLKYEGPNGPLLEAAHFKKVAEASEHFDEYLKKTRLSDQDRARANDQRNDDENEVSESDSESEKRRRKKSSSSRVAAKKAKLKAKKKSKRKTAETSLDEEESSETASDNGSSNSDSEVGSESEAEELSVKSVVLEKTKKKKKSKTREE